MTAINKTAFKLHLLFALLVVLLAERLPATWSIILVNNRTGEVAIGTATCLGFDLRPYVPVIVVGKGGAISQASCAGWGHLFFFNSLHKGTSPEEVLATLITDSNCQHAIVDVQGRAAAFTGSSTAFWAGHVTGRVGDIAYAIAANIMVDETVVSAAEAAVRNTAGDLATRLMAGMEAARAQGGDRRCNPASSSHTGYMIVARQGDAEDGCCARGTYYMNFNSINPADVPGRDPVFKLQQLLDAFRIAKQGRPDHHLSMVELDHLALPADGKTQTQAIVMLHDLTGAPITTGGATVTVNLDAESSAAVQIGQVQDLCNGAYSFAVTAGTSVGLANLRIVVDDGQGPVLLSPRTPLTLTNDRLVVFPNQVSLQTGGELDFVLQAGPQSRRRPYLMLASNAGTSPGMQLRCGLTIPLNPDPVFFLVLKAGLKRQIPGFFGRLDTSGRARVGMDIPPGGYHLPVDSCLSFAYAYLNRGLRFSNPVDVNLLR